MTCHKSHRELEEKKKTNFFPNKQTGIFTCVNQKEPRPSYWEEMVSKKHATHGVKELVHLLPPHNQRLLNARTYIHQKENIKIPESSIYKHIMNCIVIMKLVQ